MRKPTTGFRIEKPRTFVRGFSHLGLNTVLRSLEPPSLVVQRPTRDIFESIMSESHSQIGVYQDSRWLISLQSFPSSNRTHETISRSSVGDSGKNITWYHPSGVVEVEKT